MAEDALVLVVDDEIPLTGVVGSYLEREGFQTAVAHTGPDAVDRARALSPDLIILDVMLPGFDGIEVCRRVRQFSDAYIIMLTAKDEEMDKVLGLSMGADDYLVKPFSPRELIARVRAMLRRPRTSEDAATVSHQVAGIILEPQARHLTVDGTPVELTRTEFDLLAALMEHPKAVLTRRQLIDAVWGPGWYGDEHVVDVHIGHVRDKLGDDAASPRYIRTVRGVGYGMVS
ncbi:MAG: response regulator transcription factor [Actinomycetales bacterium]|jgi:DNA-binding response OmpR family regulator|nr:response regulator transcription factor [Actinomycetales bacterium]